MMFASLALTAILASGAALFAHAQVVPNEPSPGEVFNEGSSCHIGWAGDTTSTTNWKNMTIQFMTGANLAMVPLSVVATGQDGTVAGTFDYPCPEVTPNSAIYFYQFTSPGQPDQWTTRFTIASATGETTPPTNTTDGIQWGTGQLATSDCSCSTESTPATSATPSSTPATVGNTLRSTTDSPSSVASSATPSSIGSTSGSNTSTSSPSPSAGSKTANNNNGAIGSLVLDNRVWEAAVALSASALAFAILL